MGLGTLGGGSSMANGVSADGTVIVGSSYVHSDPYDVSHAFRWSGGTMTDLGTLGGTYSSASAASANGAVVVGIAGLAGGAGHAFRWTGGVMSDLGTLGGSDSVATGVSADGNIIAGYSQITGSTLYHAFRWNGRALSDLGTLGGSNSSTIGISADGSVLVGSSQITGDALYHAFRWSGGVMSDLGAPTGRNSTASATSADGAVVVGYSYVASDFGTSRAFRWSAGTMSDIGLLPGGTYSQAFAVNADGSVVVGTADSPRYFANEAFRWKASTGMQSIIGLLESSGVNVTGWLLRTATGISADGTVIVGYGDHPGTSSDAWIARCSPICSGVITVGGTMQSFSGQSAMGQTGNATIGNTLGTFTELATQAGASQGNTPFAAFGYAGYDSDPAASGTLGMTMKLPNEMVAGVMASANYVRSNMVYDGVSKMQGGGAGVFLSRVPDAGLQWLVGVSGLTLKGDVTRGYLNGNTPTSSTGNTTGNGYGVTGRIGWTFDNVWRATQVTPFASYTVSRMHFNGYTETGGPFPARMNGFDDTAQIARFGADARYTFAPGKWVWGTIATAHRLNSSQTDNITGTLIGLFDVSAPASSTAKDWLETTAGVRWPAWKNGALTASITASIPANYPTTYQARLGVTQAF